MRKLSPVLWTEVPQGCFSKHLFFTTNSSLIWCILPLPALSPVEFHFRIKVGICFLGCGVVGKNLHICGWLFHHFIRWLGSTNWNKKLRQKERISENWNCINTVGKLHWKTAPIKQEVWVMLQSTTWTSLQGWGRKQATISVLISKVANKDHALPQFSSHKASDLFLNWALMYPL